MELKRGSIFGAKTLWCGEPSARTIKSCGELSCLKMDKDTFNELVKPVFTTLRKQYEQYVSFMNQPV
jgi:hypothetical protein